MNRLARCVVFLMAHLTAVAMAGKVCCVSDGAVNISSNVGEVCCF